MSADEEKVNESYKVEIEIATALLGFLFVMESIILTMPSDVLTCITNPTFTIFSIALDAADFISWAGLYCSLSLLGAIPVARASY